MGEELNKPEKNYSPIDKENIYLKFGFNQVQGWKKSMEDYAIEFLDSGEKKFMNIFGIFDGHGGKEVPRYLQAHFLECLNKNNNFNTEKYKDGITETFFELDKNFTTKEAQEELAKYSEEFKPEKDKELKEINDLCSPNEKLSNEELEQVMAFNEVFDPRNIENANIAEFTGATGMILAICYKDILIAYAGNSRCLILDAEGKIIKQTTDHTIKSANEKKRVDLARSFNDEDEEKKKGEDEHMEYLDSTRGFGDLEFKGNEWIEQKDQEISVEPQIVLVPYDNAKYIIFGSHGMFEGDDNKINEEVRKYFFENVSKNSETKFSEIIKNYFEKIIPEDKNKNEKNIGLDNMSCFLIELKKEEIEIFIKIRDEEIKEQKRKEEEENVEVNAYIEPEEKSEDKKIEEREVEMNNDENNKKEDKEEGEANEEKEKEEVEEKSEERKIEENEKGLTEERKNEGEELDNKPIDAIYMDEEENQEDEYKQLKDPTEKKENEEEQNKNEDGNNNVEMINNNENNAVDIEDGNNNDEMINNNENNAVDIEDGNNNDEMINNNENNAVYNEDGNNNDD